MNEVGVVLAGLDLGMQVSDMDDVIPGQSGCPPFGFLGSCTRCPGFFIVMLTLYFRWMLIRNGLLSFKGKVQHFSRKAILYV